MTSSANGPRQYGYTGTRHRTPPGNLPTAAPGPRKPAAGPHQIHSPPETLVEATGSLRTLLHILRIPALVGQMLKDKRSNIYVVSTTTLCLHMHQLTACSYFLFVYFL